MNQKTKKHAETAKRSYKTTNDIVEDHGDWLEIDISTPKFPTATMAVDTDVWDRHDGGRVFSAIGGTGSKYICSRYNIDKTARLFHRDVIKSEENLDHITHGTMCFIDNRRSNLRVVTDSQNKMNSSVYSNNASGIVGVMLHKKSGKWMARIGINGKYKYLGIFDNIDFAIGARQQAEREYFGEYAYVESGGAS